HIHPARRKVSFGQLIEGIQKKSSMARVDPEERQTQPPVLAYRMHHRAVAADHQNTVGRVGCETSIRFGELHGLLVSLVEFDHQSRLTKAKPRYSAGQASPI